MKKRKKILSIALAASLAVVAIAGSSLAYFTDKDEATNTFTIGNVDIVLSEPNWDKTGKEEAKEMYPGEAVAKDPTVTNNGANPAFVRIKITWPDDVTLFTRTDWQDGISTDWTLHTDGYYYYNTVLASGATTDALFDQIMLDPFTVNGDAVTEKNIIVQAEAIQAQGAAVQWERVETMTVAEIADWFENQTQIS